MLAKAIAFLILALFPCVASGQPAANQSHDGPKHEYRPAADGDDDVVRVFHLRQTDTVEDFQEVATVVRSITELRRVFTYNAPRMVVLRGAASQVALAEWLFSELDTPANESREYRPSANPNDVSTPVRSITELRRLFTCNAPKVVPARGTASQLGLAQWLFAELDLFGCLLHARRPAPSIALRFSDRWAAAMPVRARLVLGADAQQQVLAPGATYQLDS